MKGIAVLVLRYTHPQDREYRVPLNPVIFGKEIPVGLGLITLVLFAIAVINLFTKPAATIAGITFTVLLFTVFEISEHRMRVRAAGAAHVELDQFNLAQEAELTPTSVGVAPGNILVPVSTYYALYHLEAALRRVRAKGSGDRCAARAHAASRGFRRVRSGSGPAFQHHRAVALHQSAVARGKRGQARAVWPWPQPMICGKAFCVRLRICSRARSWRAVRQKCP